MSSAHSNTVGTGSNRRPPLHPLYASCLTQSLPRVTGDSNRRIVVYEPPLRSAQFYMIKYISKQAPSRVETIVFVHMLLDGCRLGHALRTYIITWWLTQMAA